MAMEREVVSMNDYQEACLERDHALAQRDECAFNFEQLQQKARLMLEALQEVEWVHRTSNYETWVECAICYNEKIKGHRPNCKLDVAIKAATGK